MMERLTYGARKSLYTNDAAVLTKRQFDVQSLLSSLGPMVMRWFNGLRKGSIRNFGELMQAFGARFITCSKVPQLIGALLSMRMRSGETL